MYGIYNVEGIFSSNKCIKFGLVSLNEPLNSSFLVLWFVWEELEDYLDFGDASGGGKKYGEKTHLTKNSMQGPPYKVDPY